MPPDNASRSEPSQPKRGDRDCVLVISRWLPAPADNGARIRRAQLIKALGEHFDLTWFALCDAATTAGELSTSPGDFEVFRQPEFRQRSLAGLAAFVHPTPRAVVNTNSRELHERVRTFVRERQPVLVIADEIHAAHYALGRGVPVMIEELQVGHLADDRSWRGRITWAKNRRYHDRMMRAAAVCTTPSVVERDRLLRIAPTARVEIVANGVEVPSPVSAQPVVFEPDTLIYAGSPQFRANLDAVTWFGYEVLPMVRTSRPATRLIVTGATEGVDLPAIDGVEFVGRLDRVDDAVRAATCAVVPLRTGGGTRIKILESLALGTPVVSTSKGAEGLALRDDEIVIADGGADFAQAVVTMLTNTHARAAYAAAGLAAASRFDWAQSRGRWLAIAIGVAQSSGPS